MESASVNTVLEGILEEALKRPFYRDQFGTASVSDLTGLVREGRFHELPVIRKLNLRESWGAVMDLDGACDIVSSSGTTGRPVDIPVHSEELATRVLRCRRTLRELGVVRGTRVLQLLSLNDLFTKGVLAWQAIVEEGGCAMRCTPARIERVIQIIEYMRPEVVVGNPFAMVRMAEEAGAHWPSALVPKRALMAVAATFTPDLQPTPVLRRMRETWGLTTEISHYGMSETGPVAYECRKNRGLHVHDDQHYVEVISPATGRPVESDTEPGEVVITALTSPRGFLPVRFATGDIVAWVKTDPCECGRISRRLGPVIGRTDMQLKLLGQTVFPELLLELADSCAGVQRAAVRIRTGRLNQDDVAMLLIADDPTRHAAVKEELLGLIGKFVPAMLEVEFISPSELAKLEASASKAAGVKIARVFDFRGAPAPVVV